MNIILKMAIEKLQETTDVFLPIDQLESILEEYEKKKFSDVEKAEEFLKRGVPQFSEYFSNKADKQEEVPPLKDSSEEHDFLVLSHRTFNFHRLFTTG